MFVRKTGIALIGILLLALVSAAQTGSEAAPASEPGRSVEGRGYFTLGLQNAKLSDLNGPMVSQGFSRFGETFFLLGGGGMAVLGRLILGGEGYVLFDQTSSRGPVKARVGAGCGFFDLGYVFWRNDALQAYGLVGLGGGGWTLRITDSASGPFETVLGNPSRSSTLTTSGFLVSLSLGVDWYYRFGGTDQGEGGMSFGLRAGYTLAPFKSEWEMQDFEVTSGPKMGLAGPSVRLVIGFGGKRGT